MGHDIVDPLPGRGGKLRERDTGERKEGNWREVERERRERER